MNRKQFVILLGLLVVLGAAGIMRYQRNRTSWQNASQSLGKKLLADLPINDVASIVIRSGTNELDLVRKADPATKDTVWRVAQRNDYPANFTEISGFLLKAADLKAAQTEEIGPSQLGRYKLLPPGPATNTGVLVEFRDSGGKTLKSLLLGKSHMRKSGRGAPSPMGEGEDEGSPDGRYVMVGTNSKTVAVLSDPLGNMDVKADQWLNKDFFKAEKIRSIAVSFPAGTNSWKVSRDTETGSDWKLADARPEEQVDSSKTSGFNYALSSPSFSDVLPASTPESQTGLDHPTNITVETFDNFTYTIKVGAKTNDNLAIAVSVAADLPKERAPGKDEKPEDKDKLDKEFKEKQKKLEDKLAAEKPFEKWVYLVSTWTVDSMLKDRAQLLTEKKEEPKTNEVNSAQMKLDIKPPIGDGTNAAPGEAGTNAPPTPAGK